MSSKAHPVPERSRADTKRRPPRLSWWLLLWLPAGAIALLLSVLLALWLWAGSAGSLGQALHWAQVWLEDQPPAMGRLEVQGVEGSLRRGGQLQRLRWEQEGLTVEAEGIHLDLPHDWLIDMLARRHLDFTRLHLDRLTVRDARPGAAGEAESRAPPEQLTLPVTVHLPWSIDRLDLPGDHGLHLKALRGTYQYTRAPQELGTAQAHRLELERLEWAEGQYRAELTLGAQAPMPLRLQASGEVRVAVPDGLAQDLVAWLQAEGPLGGMQANLNLQLQLRAAAAAADEPPALEARARLRPWDGQQPLERFDARVNRLDLAGLWPDAPRTVLTGEAQVTPHNTGWLARIELGNARPAPLDRQGWPLDQLRLELNRTATHWELPLLEARLGDGRLRGQGQVSMGEHAIWLGAWNGLLQLERLDPARLWSVLAPGRLEGELRATSVEAPARTYATAFDARLLNTAGTAQRQAPDALPLDELRASGRWQAPADHPAQGELQFQSLTVRALGLQLEGQTRLDLSDGQLDGRLQLRAPGWSALWTGAAGAARGQGELVLDLADGDAALRWFRSLRMAPWLGQRLGPDLDALEGIGLEGQGKLRLGWQGGLAALGYPGTSSHPPNPLPSLALDLDLNLPRLALRTDPQAGAWMIEAGRLRLAGAPEALDIDLTARLSGDPIDLRVDTRGRIETRWPAAARSLITPAESGRWWMERLNVRVGLPAQGPLGWQLTHAGPISTHWKRSGPGWQWGVDAGALRLQALPAGRPDGEPVRIAWERLDWNLGALSTQGSVAGVPLAWLDLLTAPEDPNLGLLAQAGIRSDLLLQGRWDVRLPAGAQALPQVLLQVERQQGDLTLRTDGLAAGSPNGSASRVAAGVRSARLEIANEGRTVQAQLQWDTERLGQIDARLGSTLSPPDDTHLAWHWAAQAPLSGRLQARLPEVGAWSALAPPGWRIQGTLEAEAQLSGTRQEPRWQGLLRADNLAVRSVVDGFAFAGGSLRASLDGDRLRVDRLSLQGPGAAGEGGELEASGSAQWRSVFRDGQRLREPLIELQASARQLRVSNRPDRRLTLSGQLQARLDGSLLDIRGRLAADNALFLLPDEFTPSLDPDVVVRGRGTPLPPNGARVRTQVEVDIDLGRQFEVRGQGLSTRLGGQLTVRATPALPSLRVLGEVRTQSGTYRAYGQQLSIETGVLRFAGPYDDPGLDIVAVRPNLRDQRVGVQILGTAQRPQVRLFSDPDLPDSEKLAWLVLGRPATGAGAEMAILQQAALALLAGDGEGAGTQLAGFLGLDQLALVDRGEGGDAISLGKRFSNRLYVSYEYGLLSTLGTVSVFYDASRWLTLRARAGEENALDLIFTREFD